MILIMSSIFHIWKIKLGRELMFKKGYGGFNSDIPGTIENPQK